jgi:ATP-dependent Clp protease protease subunit
MNPPPAPPPHWFLGYNWLIESNSINRLLSSVGLAVEKGATEITLCLNSSGGTTDQAFYAYEILRAMPVMLTTFNLGYVQSAAMLLFMAGAKRLAVPHAQFLMHATTRGVTVPMDDHDLTFGSASVRSDDERSASIIAERTGKDIATVRKWFSGQKLRSTEFAHANNIITVAPVPFQLPAGSQFVQLAAN